MKTMYNLVLTFSLSVLITSTGCKKEIESTITKEPESATLTEAGRGNIPQMKIYKGPEVQMGNGRAHTWISTISDLYPIEIGVSMSEGALTGLPGDSENNQSTQFVLPLHQRAKALTAFDHVVVNWNVHGHEPLNLFGVPHFDFHFYTISQQERLSIPPYVPMGPHDNLPPLNQRPAGYIPTEGGVPQMGKHWVSPPLAPTFTSVMIYGSYNGKINFVEPMVTLAMLEAGTEYSSPYGQPAFSVPNRTYYPTIYNVYKDAESGSHHVTLSQFTWRN